jgi:hypothetical protein
VCLDTFYIGNLKGAGEVCQITACDAPTSYGLAGLLPTHDATAAPTFLRAVVVPHFQRAGWPVRRVLTDGGPEFKGAFDVAWALRHTRTKNRHAWTNGFVGRLQGTIVQEALARGLPAALLHHSGGPAGPRRLHALLQYGAPASRLRVRGRTPAALLRPVAAAQ